MSLFLHLLYAGEMVVKVLLAGIVASVQDDTERHRYRLAYRLVRADGIGEWGVTLDDLLVGPASQHICDEARVEQRELTKRCDPGEWQHECVAKMDECLRVFSKDREGIPFKLEARRWVHLFAELRNKTRGHGASSGSVCGKICPSLERSIRCFADNSMLFRRQWVYLHRNLSGKYRVTKLGETSAEFDTLKGSRAPSEWGKLRDGIYVYLGRPRHVELIASDPEAGDFLLPNGFFGDKKFEQISYITDTRRDGDSSIFLSPATDLPPSETQGLGRLEVQGRVFGNIPQLPPGYVKRNVLEKELLGALEDDKRSIVTLVGRGGIGKTVLALSVLHRICEEERFGAIVWLSARDIDLLPGGPKIVKPHVLSQKDIAREFVHLMEPSQAGTKGFNALTYFSDALGRSPIDRPILFVFDNFETVQSPGELFMFLDTYARLPNKVLITTRTRDFKGDYPVDVLGMTEDESEQLIDIASDQLGIRNILTTGYRKELIREADGHPYVIKVLLGDVARAHRLIEIERIVSSKDKILEALFERTYGGLSPAAKQVFLTLCNWRSTVPQIAVEAVMLRPANEKMDVEEAIDELQRCSFIEITFSPDDRQNFISVPLTAAVFGQRKLKVSPMKAAVEANTQLLLYFGAGQKTDIRHGIATRIERFFTNVADKVATNYEALDSYLPMMEFIAQRHPDAWLLLARMYEETPVSENEEKAKSALERYLETGPGVDQRRAAWERLAYLCRKTEDRVREIHALIELCSLPDTTFKALSVALNRWNSIFKQAFMLMPGDERQILGRKLLKLFEDRIDEADATDISRAAWLSIAMHNEPRARELVRRGLEMEPENEYCTNLATKLGVELADGGSSSS
ncbi:MAG: NB-ARC domain-containing protein [Terriglobia bacterium]|nr:NB-ARC domain-containing protein [Terriglobia bacterium]